MVSADDAFSCRGHTSDFIRERVDKMHGTKAIKWIMERYQVTTHKESGIRNDPNDWAVEVGNPRCILDLLMSVVRVSLQTVEIVEKLPNVNFE
jgi:predicted helicase